MATKQLILIIDDDPTIRDLYKQRFVEAGFDVKLATNGNEGVETALSTRPAAILLDLMMPMKGGLGALDVFKTMPETKNIPIIVLTAYPADEYRDKSNRAGASMFLSKAETMPGEIVEQVQALLSQ